MTSRRVKRRKRWKRKLKRIEYDRCLKKFMIKTDLLKLLLPGTSAKIDVAYQSCPHNIYDICHSCQFLFNSPVGVIGLRCQYVCAHYGGELSTYNNIAKNYQYNCQYHTKK